MWPQNYRRIPFVEKGRDEKGCDCWGLVQLIYRQERGIELPGYEHLYENTKQRKHLENLIFQERQTRWREVTEPQEFDCVLLKMMGVPIHVGIVTRPGKMIHCGRDINTVHERYDGLRWENKVEGFFRYE